MSPKSQLLSLASLESPPWIVAVSTWEGPGHAVRLGSPWDLGDAPRSHVTWDIGKEAEGTLQALVLDDIHQTFLLPPYWLLCTYPAKEWFNLESGIIVY